MKRRTDLETALAINPATRAARAFALWYALGPVIDWYANPRAEGLENLVGLRPPVIFAANHSSHLDTPVILRAIPGRWRKRTVVLAAADYFFRNRIKGLAVTLVVGAVPIERRGLDKRSTDRINALIRSRWNILFYPEGTRSRSGRLGRLRTGAAFLAVTYQIPIVPVFVEGTHEAMPVGARWLRRHPVTVHVGMPLYPQPGEDHRRLRDRLYDSLVKMSDAASDG